MRDILYNGVGVTSEGWSNRNIGSQNIIHNNMNQNQARSNYEESMEERRAASRVLL